MLRYLRLYAYFIRFSFMKAMAYRLDFWFRILMDAFFYMVNIAFFKIIFLHSGSIGGWNEEQSMIFVGAFITIDALQMTLLANNLWALPMLVNKGDLDYYLLRPVSPLFFISLREFAANSCVNLMMAVGILVWALERYSQPLDVLNIILFLLLILNGLFLFYLVRLVFALPVFWTQASTGLEHVFWSLSHLSERPDRIFRGLFRIVLVTILPFGLMASFPAHVLFEGPSFQIMSHIILTTGGLALTVFAIWRRALRVYGSASS